MPTVTRITSTGTLLVNGTFDEVNGPIVTNGLRLWLEAANPNSYPGSGTTWTDLSGNGNNGTLNNGVGFDSFNGGLVFDGSNDYVDLNTNNIITGTNPFTFSCFYTITAVNGGGEIFGNYGVGYSTNYLWISGEYGAYLDGSVYFPGAPLSAGTYHMAVTRDASGLVILYKNGVQVASGTLANSIAVGPNFRLGADVTGSATVGGERLNGKIYQQLVYNRALTAAEITQNYNARRQVFALEATSSTTVVGKISINTNTVFASEFDEFTGAPVVDSSLVLWLDAGQTASYSGSGSTWTDLSGNGNNGTLVNAPSFISTDGGGCIQLDGSNDHITLPVTGFAPASLTIDYWIKRISDNGYFWLIDNSDQPELRMLFQSSGKLQIYFYDDGAYFSTALSSTTFNTDSWYNITATLTNGLQNVYINGNQEIITTTGTYTGGPSGNAGEHTLGTYNRPAVGYGGYANVRIGSYKFYNRVLTTAEIIQNYNALQSRYGLPSITSTQMPVVQRQQSSGTLLINSEFDEFTGAPIVDSSLQLWLDAGQTTSYSGTGTTWTDLSGNGRTGTLTNGPTYSATNGGSIVFDGTNDYVQCTGSLTVTAATFVAWIRRDGTQTNYDGIFFNRGAGDNVTGLNIGQTGTSNEIGYHWHALSTTYFFTSNLTIPDLTWCMIAVSVTSTAATLYLCQSSGITTATNTTNHPSTVLSDIKIAQDDIGSRFFKGNIAAAQLYNKALTADEITTNFNALRGRYGI